MEYSKPPIRKQILHECTKEQEGQNQLEVGAQKQGYQMNM